MKNKGYFNSGLVYILLFSAIPVPLALMIIPFDRREISSRRLCSFTGNLRAL